MKQARDFLTWLNHLIYARDCTAPQGWHNATKSLLPFLLLPPGSKQSPPSSRLQTIATKF